jgi:hypothetical protein
MKIEILNPLDIPDWEAMARVLPGYSFFHTSAWGRVLAESYGYEPTYFTGWEGNELRAVVPVMEVNSIWTGRRGVSLPFSDYCEPLLGDGADFAALLDAIQNYGRERGWKFIELRGAGPSMSDQKSSNNYYGHRLDLSRGAQALQKGLRDSSRRNIKKAEKSEVKVEIGQSADAMRAFYRLNCMTRQRHGLPPQPLSFFKKFFQYIINPGLGSIVLARLDDKFIAGAVYVHTRGNGGDVLYKYGASDKTHQHLRANNLVMWKAIEWYAGHGFDSMLMGRTDLDHEGLRQFKMGWNTEEYRIDYHRYDLRSAAFTNGSTAGGNKFETAVLRHTPLPILRAMGRVVYRHFG